MSVIKDSNDDCRLSITVRRGRVGLCVCGTILLYRREGHVMAAVLIALQWRDIIVLGQVVALSFGRSLTTALLPVLRLQDFLNPCSIYLGDNW